MLAKQPGVDGLLPVLMLMVPVVSDPLIDTVPPAPSNEPGPEERLGDGPVKARWLGICSTALPLNISLVTVICEAVMAPLNDDVPDTLRSRSVVVP